MFTVYVVALDDLAADIVHIVKSVNGASLMGSTPDLREALAIVAMTLPGVLVVDDELLEAMPGMVASLQQVQCPIILLTRGQDAAAARRALNIRARDLVQVSQLAAELPSAMLRYAQRADGDQKLGRILTIYSSKGGVGKTTLAVNLAVALGALTRRPTALVDLDLQFGDAAALLGDPPNTTIHDLALQPQVDHTSLGRALVVTANGHVHLLAAPTVPTDAADVGGDLVAHLLTLLRESHDYVIVDTAPGVNDVNVAALDLSDDILTVVTPDVVTVRTIKQVLDLFHGGFRYPTSKVRLVMNRAGSETGLAPDDITSALNTPIEQSFPSDGTSPVRAANQGKALYLVNPDSGFAQQVKQMAARLVEEQGGRLRSVRERGRAPVRPSLFNRVLRRT